ncbi:LON peptidase substrate-binding domain-containing protein [Pseudaquabacterium pictum]|uniref:ATP-dependent protease n=1 Tax=Pseudaquabacterium pictum TaxID=2315236 RepID=A0A480AT42_9BURK|nr:LON peptidase substrate-binding domain-containing protein [Rubrivivax pictus]GCL64136.1 ATP-dependent protease [Rubrivivax pictus]
MTTAAAPQAGAGPWTALPLFPLGTVLFPGGLLPLKVFEARYLDLVSHCLRTNEPFAVVHIRQGSELRGAGSGKTLLEAVGVLAHVQEVDAEQPGILRVRCTGGLRVHLGATHQRDDGLWLAAATAGAPDPAVPLPAELQPAADALGRAIEALDGQGHHPFLQPHALDDAGWVANRWCEILPISGAAKQRLMALDEPVLRLQLVQDYLQGKGLL